jgi:hypothetical protein
VRMSMCTCACMLVLGVDENRGGVQNIQRTTDDGAGRARKSTSSTERSSTTAVVVTVVKNVHHVSMT